ncbi:MAG: DUF1643 domain-containing protein [bacterium]
MASTVHTSANFSRCRTYRYALRRVWRKDASQVMFVGLNPSTADERDDDPTVRRCVGFARSWGYGGVILTNLFGYRSPDPQLLVQIADPIGPRTDWWLRRLAVEADLTVAAWGARGGLYQRDRIVLKKLAEPCCLGLTQAGYPRHPLYLPAETKPAPLHD